MLCSGSALQGWGREGRPQDDRAEESGCPWEWGEEFRVVESAKPMNFRNASGGTITHWGHRDVCVTSPF